MSLFDPIPPHKKPLFRFEDVPYGKGRRYVKAYSHSLTDFLPYHTHDFYEINLVTDGVGVHRLGKREILTRAGDVFIIPPHRPHGYSCQGALTVYHVLLGPAFWDAFLPYLSAMKGFDLLFHIEPMLRERVETPYYLRAEDVPFDQWKLDIARLEECRGEENESEAIFHVLSLLASLSRAAESRHTLSPFALSEEGVPSVLESMAYIETHFDQKTDFALLARQSALSYSTYLRVFKALSGTTPARFQTRCRIRRAASLLLNTEESILSIALTCGFYDSSHFIREFIKEKGTTPAAFRKEHAPLP